MRAKLALTRISILIQTPITSDTLFLINSMRDEIDTDIVVFRRKSNVLRFSTTNMTSPKLIEETWQTLIEKCDEISDNLHSFYIDDEIDNDMLPFVNAAYEWKLRAIELSNNCNIPVEHGLHLDLLNLRELQWDLQREKRSEISESIRNY